VEEGALRFLIPTIAGGFDHVDDETTTGNGNIASARVLIGPSGETCGIIKFVGEDGISHHTAST